MTQNNLNVVRLDKNRTNHDTVFSYAKYLRLGQKIISLPEDKPILLRDSENANIETISVPADLVPILQVLHLIHEDPQSSTEVFMSYDNNKTIAEQLTTTMAKIQTGLAYNKLSASMLIDQYDVEKKLAAAWSAITRQLVKIFKDNRKAASALSLIRGLFMTTLYESRLLTLDKHSEVAIVTSDIPAYDYIPSKHDLNYAHVYIELTERLFDYYTKSGYEEIKRVATAMHDSIIELRNSRDKTVTSIKQNEVSVYLRNLSDIMALKLTEFCNEIGKIRFSQDHIDDMLALISYHLDETERLASESNDNYIINHNFNLLDEVSKSIISKYAQNPYIVAIAIKELGEKDIQASLNNLLGQQSGPSSWIKEICLDFERLFTSPYSRFKLVTKKDAIKHLRIKCYKDKYNNNKVVYITRDKYGVSGSKVETYAWVHGLTADSHYSIDPNAEVIYRTGIKEELLGDLASFDEINLKTSNALEKLLEQYIVELSNTETSLTYVITSGLSDLDLMNLGYYYSDQLFIDARQYRSHLIENFYKLKKIDSKNNILSYYVTNVPETYIKEQDPDLYDPETKIYMSTLYTLDLFKLISLKAINQEPELMEFIIPDNLTNNEVSFNMTTFLHYNRNRVKLAPGDEYCIEFKDDIFSNENVKYDHKLSDIINLSNYISYNSYLVVHEYNYYLQARSKENFFLILLLRAEQSSLLLWDANNKHIARRFEGHDNILTNLHKHRIHQTSCSVKWKDKDQDVNELDLDNIMADMVKYCQSYESAIYPGNRPSLDLTNISNTTYNEQYNSFYRQLIHNITPIKQLLQNQIDQQLEYILVEENRTIDFFIANLRIQLGRETPLNTIAEKITSRINRDTSTPQNIQRASEDLRYYFREKKVNPRTKALLKDKLDLIALHMLFGLFTENDTFMYSVSKGRSLKAFANTILYNFHLALLTKEISHDIRYKVWSLADTDIFDNITVNMSDRFKYVADAKPELGMTTKFTANILDNMIKNTPKGGSRLAKPLTFHQSRAQADELTRFNNINGKDDNIREVLDQVFGKRG